MAFSQLSTTLMSMLLTTKSNPFSLQSTGMSPLPVSSPLPSKAKQKGCVAKQKMLKIQQKNEVFSLLFVFQISLDYR